MVFPVHDRIIWKYYNTT